MSGSNGGYGRGRPRFSDEDRRSILARHDAGASIAALAREYQCTPEAIRYHLKRTLRYVPAKDRHDHERTLPGGSCIRCGIDLGRPGMCLDCLDVEGMRS